MRDAYGLPINRRAYRQPKHRRAGTSYTRSFDAASILNESPEHRHERMAHAYVNRARSLMKRKLVLQPAAVYDAFNQGIDAEAIAALNDKLADEYTALMEGGRAGLERYHQHELATMIQDAATEWDPGTCYGSLAHLNKPVREYAPKARSQKKG